jgi:hypothetical protein
MKVVGCELVSEGTVAVGEVWPRVDKNRVLDVVDNVWPSALAPRMRRHVGARRTAGRH